MEKGVVCRSSLGLGIRSSDLAAISTRSFRDFINDSIPSSSNHVMSIRDMQPLPEPSRKLALRRTALSALQWIRNVISPLPEEPDQNLLECFSHCNKPDIESDIKRRVESVSASIFHSPSIEELKIDSGIRKSELLKLYYHVLTAMCRAETQRLQKPNLSPLLNNDCFQKSVIFCCSDLIFVANYRRSLFPDLLPAVGVSAYDFSKVIESVVRSDGLIPGDLKRHLNSCEEKVLEFLAWKPASTLYITLASAKKDLAPEILRLALLPRQLSSEPSLRWKASGKDAYLEPPKPPSRSASGAFSPPGSSEGRPTPMEFRSPENDRKSAFMSPGTKDISAQQLHSAFASPQRPVPSGGGGTFSEVQFKVFSKKVLKLSAMRIRSVCERLNQPSSLQEQIYRLMSHVIQQETYLMFNRHLDQIVLSSVYGVCKVCQVDVTFKKIITCYIDIPGSAPDVFRKVFLDGTFSGLGEIEPHYCDIIRFYNEVFVPATKQFLLKITAPGLAPQGDDATVEESPFKSLPQASPKRVSVAPNVFVSPLREPTADPVTSPRSRVLLTCLGDSSTPFHSPSKAFSEFNDRMNPNRDRRLGRLDFEDVSNEIVSHGSKPATGSGTGSVHADHSLVNATQSSSEPYQDNHQRGQILTTLSPPPTPFKKQRTSK